MMKKLSFKLLIAMAMSLACFSAKAQTPYIGGSLTAAYSNVFRLDTHFLGGYEFNDKWAVGGGIGLDLTGYEHGATTSAFLGMNIRFTPWHSNVLYTDIKWRTEALLGDGVRAADIGLCGSLRFRLNSHIDIFVDCAPLGVRYSSGRYYPLIGILGDGCSMGLHYRF